MNSDIDFNDFKKVFFFGIGGIGISAVARMFLLEGKIVVGSDISMSEVTDGLVEAGAKIEKGQSLSLVPKDTELLIYTAALENFDAPLLAEIKKLKIPSISYSEALGIISKNKYTIAVSGTHGKTTTTAMIAKVLIDAGLKPTVLVGSILKEYKSNFVMGEGIPDSKNEKIKNGGYFVVEADEYKKSFHSLYPSILVINNIDADHLDFYKDLADIQKAFNELALRVPVDGVIVCNAKDTHTIPALKDVKCQIIDYTEYKKEIPELSVPGEHNRNNASCAYALVSFLGISGEIIKKSLTTFSGTWRRFELKGETKKGTLVYDDYAHNPQKVTAVLQGTREKYPDKKIIAIFQPHLFSRTKSLLKEFSESFSLADEVIILPIYPAREANDPTITSDMLVREVKKNNVKVTLASRFEKAKDLANEMASKGDIILVIGAGDVYKIAEELANEYFLKT